MSQQFKVDGRWVDIETMKRLKQEKTYGVSIKSPEKISEKRSKIKGKIADIVIPHHNRHDHLKNCLDLLPNDIFNIIIVSGGTFAHNCNEGAKLAKTDNIIILNDDTLPNVEYLIEMCEMKEDIVGAYQIIPSVGQTAFTGIDIDIRLGKINAYLSSMDNPTVPTGFLYRFKKKAWKDLEGFDEVFKNGGEDTDLGLRALEKKMSIGYFKKPIIHAHSQSEGRLRYSKENHELLEDMWPEERLKKILGNGGITVVIPNKKGQKPDITVNSLKKQTVSHNVIVVNDKGKGAQWARNEGFKKVDTEFVLFSDNDLEWEPDALAVMVDKLRRNPQASYCYGHYEIEGQIQCNKMFDPEALKKCNFISTMSLIRTRDFPGFDEKIQRLQDWDLYLTMLERGKIGVYCEKKVFSTKKREGITFGGRITWEEAEKIVKEKHGLC